MPSASGRSLFASACVGIPFVAWVHFLQFCIVGPDLPYNGETPSAAGLPHWVLNELAWWWIVCRASVLPRSLPAELRGLA